MPPTFTVGRSTRSPDGIDAGLARQTQVTECIPGSWRCGLGHAWDGSSCGPSRQSSDPDYDVELTHRACDLGYLDPGQSTDHLD